MSSLARVLLFAVTLTVVLAACQSPGAPPDDGGGVGDPFGEFDALTKDQPEEITFDAQGAWTLQADAPWLRVTPSSGSGGTVTATLRADLARLPQGGDPSRDSESTTLRLQDAAGERTAMVTVELPDMVPPEDDGWQPELETGGARSTTVPIENAGAAPLELSDAFGDAEWLDASLPVDTTVEPGDIADVLVSAECGDQEGTFEGSVTVVHDDPFEGPVTIEVDLTCGAPNGDGGGGNGDGFSIEVVFYDDEDLEPGERDTFHAAADRWAEVVTGDLPDVVVDKSRDACGVDEPAYSDTVDDALVFASITDIDGSGGTVAQAGPCRMRTDGSGLPLWGVMRFDRADLDLLRDNADLEGVVTHEMGHVLGFGTITTWDELVSPQPCPDGGEPYYFGDDGVREWQNHGGTGEVPVEHEYGTGTDCGHWDEAELYNELMTGVLDADMRLSSITVGALDDLGYQVDYAAADPYSLPVTSIQAQRADGWHLQEELIRPSDVE